jgi:hypothetical protein
VVGAFERVGGAIDAALREGRESMRTRVVQDDPILFVVSVRDVALSQKFQHGGTIRIEFVNTRERNPRAREFAGILQALLIRG